MKISSRRSADGARSMNGCKSASNLDPTPIVSQIVEAEPELFISGVFDRRPTVTPSFSRKLFDCSALQRFRRGPNWTPIHKYDDCDPSFRDHSKFLAKLPGILGFSPGSHGLPLWLLRLGPDQMVEILIGAAIEDWCGIEGTISQKRAAGSELPLACSTIE
jgi:hypothetical protein